MQWTDPHWWEATLKFHPSSNFLSQEYCRCKVDGFCSKFLHEWQLVNFIKIVWLGATDVGYFGIMVRSLQHWSLTFCWIAGITQVIAPFPTCLRCAAHFTSPYSMSCRDPCMTKTVRAARSMPTFNQQSVWASFRCCTKEVINHKTYS